MYPFMISKKVLKEMAQGRHHKSNQSSEDSIAHTECGQAQYCCSNNRCKRSLALACDRHCDNG